jgi:hypothetical protein
MVDPDRLQMTRHIELHIDTVPLPSLFNGASFPGGT